MMNRTQTMEQLKKLLSDISEAERQEALDYYESYFDEAEAGKRGCCESGSWEARARLPRSSKRPE